MAGPGPARTGSHPGPGPSSSNIENKDELAKQILMLQVRAFIEASEDVDIDPETLEDLMGALPSGGDDVEGQEEEMVEISIDDEEEDDWEDNPNGDDQEEVDLSALFDTPELEEDDWTEEEINGMMSFLKEKGMSAFVKEYVLQRSIPVLRLLRAFGVRLHPDLQRKRPGTLIYFLKVAMARELRMREKLAQYNTIDDAVHLIRNSKRILILTGAGISVSCGIPDFRSKNGLYATLKERGAYDLDDPQQMFDINYFKENPTVFYSFASQIYPSNFTPSPCHRFIKLVEDKGQLLRNYTQNIDTLETLAGVSNVLQCHGSFATASCLQCKRKVPGKEIEAEIMKQKVPVCPECGVEWEAEKKRREKELAKKKGKKPKGKQAWDSDLEDGIDWPEYPPGIMKPDITFFGEKLTDDFDNSLEKDRELVDLLLVIGTSLKVAPVADILSHLPHSVPQILINKTPIKHINPDISLLGDADDIIEYLCTKLEWKLPAPPEPVPLPTNGREHLVRESRKDQQAQKTPEIKAIAPPERVGDSHVYLFEGADGGKWLKDFRKALGLPTPLPSRPPSAPGSVPASATPSGTTTPVVVSATGVSGGLASIPAASLSAVGRSESLGDLGRRKRGTGDGDSDGSVERRSSREERALKRAKSGT